MKYENIKNYGPEKFRRITGIKIKTYKKCIEILNKKYAEEHVKNLENDFYMQRGSPIYCLQATCRKEVSEQ